MMKKTLLLFMVLLGALTAQAGDAYPYLTFETTDGTRVSVSTESLSLSFSGTTLTAGEQEFTLENLSKMYFSTSDESTTGVETIQASQLSIDEAAEVYDLQGKRVSRNQMRKGAYIVKTKQGTSKLVVK